MAKPVLYPVPLTLSLDDWTWLLVRLGQVNAAMPPGIEEARLERVITCLKGQMREILLPILNEAQTCGNREVTCCNGGGTLPAAESKTRSGEST